ncbi:hypothetical protein V9T40_003389 [Parthenolecanium corni]|uniref:Uncharacterized protein n=1 Tax=Parthenolecanium corni TaxID=536013 RepID=A0AAN9TQL4_9HEMI
MAQREDVIHVNDDFGEEVIRIDDNGMAADEDYDTHSQGCHTDHYNLKNFRMYNQPMSFIPWSRLSNFIDMDLVGSGIIDPDTVPVLPQRPLC